MSFELIRGLESDYYRLYRTQTPKGVYYVRKLGKEKSEIYKLKRWDKKVNMQVGHLPVSNVKFLGNDFNLIK